MATECSARGAVMEVDDTMLRWIVDRRPGTSVDALRGKVVQPDKNAHYHGGVHTIDLAKIQPMVATPGDPDRGVASDPKNGALIPEIGRVKIDIAYGGSCTAGKRDDIDMYAHVIAEAERAGKRVPEGVKFYIQFGSQEVEAYARTKGYLDLFSRTGVQVIKPGCGASSAGPGVSARRSGDRLGDQSQPRALGPWPSVPRVATHRRRVRGHGRDRRVQGRDVRAEEVSVVSCRPMAKPKTQAKPGAKKTALKKKAAPKAKAAPKKVAKPPPRRPPPRPPPSRPQKSRPKPKAAPKTSRPRTSPKRRSLHARRVPRRCR
jgi:hypothetical protein